jgi:toxin secretion/phage lysis holin
MNWNRFSQELKGGCGLLACSLTFLFGNLDNLLQVFLALLALDYFTGVLASFISGKILNSRKGLEGIAKKVMLLTLVVLSNLMDNMLHTPGSLRALVIGFLVANESISILENCKKCGIPIPLKLKETIDRLKNTP